MYWDLYIYHEVHDCIQITPTCYFCTKFQRRNFYGVASDPPSELSGGALVAMAIPRGRRPPPRPAAAAGRLARSIEVERLGVAKPPLRFLQLWISISVGANALFPFTFHHVSRSQRCCRENRDGRRVLSPQHVTVEITKIVTILTIFAVGLLEKRAGRQKKTQKRSGPVLWTRYVTVYGIPGVL